MLAEARMSRSVAAYATLSFESEAEIMPTLRSQKLAQGKPTPCCSCAAP